MAEIFVCKPGSISDDDRAVLRDVGIVVVRMRNPSDFRLIRAQVQPDFYAGELLAAAIKALSPASDAKYGNADTNRAAFFTALAASIAGGDTQ